jgi:hypothetical protein
VLVVGLVLRHGGQAHPLAWISWFLGARLLARFFLTLLCPSAFEKLVESHMLSAEEEAGLLACLRFKEDELWLKAMYRGRLHKYDVSVLEPLSLAAEDHNMHDKSAAHASEGAETRVCALDRARAILANRLPACCHACFA